MDDDKKLHDAVDNYTQIVIFFAARQIDERHLVEARDQFIQILKRQFAPEVGGD